MSSRTGAVIVLSTPMTEPQAQRACASLGERLWYPDGSKNEFLQYLDFQGNNGPYWIAGRQGPSCKDLTANGIQGLKHCPNLMPALCTQSAPLSNLSYADNATTWQTTVRTGQQTVTGFRDKYSFRFEGVRYAAQPERFTYSSVYNESGHSDALNFGSECVQGVAGSEDCLFLNIWTPYLPTHARPSAGTLKPVMLWIHGGAFTSGTGSDPTFDGGSLVSRGDVVVITINYRLGTFGFLALDDGVTNGNFGLADQITALEWVHQHIRDFGGDPLRITIFGQSAGAASVRALLASPMAIGKYAAAIPMSNLAGSNYATPYSQYYTIAQEVAVAANPVLNSTGCLNATSQVDCLRSIDPYVLSSLTDVARFLVVDGTYLVTDELEVSGKGPAAHVPVMMGFMRDDGAAFITYPEANDTVSSFVVENGFNLSTISSLSVFPEPNGANKTLDVYNTTALIATDSEFRCLDEATAYSAVQHDVFSEVYFYEFNRSYQLSFFSPNPPVCQAPVEPGYPNGNPSAEYFKCHSGELYYTFGTIVFNGQPLRDEDDIPMSQFIVDTWSAFARTYDPNPDPTYLDARGFTNTTMEMERSGSKWLPVTGESRTLRLLEYPSSQQSFGIYDGQVECQALGFGIDYYETHS
ncbi:hypothetical protein LTR36_010238 [Oleoguttula mirabilis]|uniref:Carboxylic ester hydrolase n=1 Tax=Oleoguttula mirabilis TaxID=1507867 RepID=A0AAV9JS54_9PEZI|nr:hypothetical protein LTR36_010238 [Oleoguttula mirabilis]